MPQTKFPLRAVTGTLLLLQLTVALPGVTQVRLDQPADRPATTLLVPHYEVEVGVLTGQSTLFGLRNTSFVGAGVDILYHDKNGIIKTFEQIVIPGAGVYTRNLRDVPNLLPDGDGMARGYVTITSDRLLSGDIFQLDQPNAYADGSRMVELSDTCTLWDIRFVQGGPFSGGTRLFLWTNNPRGGNRNVDPPTASFQIYDEAGTLFGQVPEFTDTQSTEIQLSSVLEELPGNVPTFGSMTVAIAPPGGHLDALFSALGLYSIGIKASCIG